MAKYGDQQNIPVESLQKFGILGELMSSPCSNMVPDSLLRLRSYSVLVVQDGSLSPQTTDLLGTFLGMLSMNSMP